MHTKSSTSKLARKLYSLRMAAGLTQVELAIAADVSIQTVAGIEQGKRKGSPRTLRQLAHALGIDPAELRSITPSRS